MDTEFQFGEMERVLETHLVTVARMYLMPLNGTLNMVNMLNFTLCIFYHNKKSLFLKSRYDST